MIITEKWLMERDACSPGLTWFQENDLDGIELFELLDNLLTVELEWLGWLLGEIKYTDDVHQWLKDNIVWMPALCSVDGGFKGTGFRCPDYCACAEQCGDNTDPWFKLMEKKIV